MHSRNTLVPGALVALFACAAACGPPAQPGGDAQVPPDVSPSDARADAATPLDAGADRATPPGDDVPDVRTTPADAPLDLGAPVDDAGADDAGADAVPPRDAQTSIDVAPSSDVQAPVDTVLVDVAPPDVARADARDASDAAPDAPLGCALPIARTLQLPRDAVTARFPSVDGVLPRAGCAQYAGGPEHVYRLAVAARTAVQFHAASGDETPTIIAVRRACADYGPASEVACDDDSGEGHDALLRASLEPGDYYVVVDEEGIQRGGLYTLTVSAFEPAANRTCAAATPLASGVPAAGDTATGSLTAEQTATCENDGASGRLFYAYEVPAGSRVDFAARSTGSEATRLALRVVSSCAVTTCLALSRAAVGGVADATYINAGTTPTTVYASVSADGTPDAPFTLVATESAVPPATNVACAAATPLAAGVTLASQDTRAATETNAACEPRGVGRVLYYTVAVPPRHQLRVDVRPIGATFDPVVRLFDACGAPACLASADVGAGGVAERLMHRNTSNSTQRLVLSVGGYTAAPGFFDVRAEVAPL